MFNDPRLQRLQKDLQDLNKAQGDINGDIQRLRSDMNAKIARIQKDYEADISSLQRKFDTNTKKIPDVMRQIDKLQTDLQTAFNREQKSAGAPDTKRTAGWR